MRWEWVARRRGGIEARVKGEEGRGGGGEGEEGEERWPPSSQCFNYT